MYGGKNNYQIIEMRLGEKLHEIMIPKEESMNCIEFKDYFHNTSIILCGMQKI